MSLAATLTMSVVGGILPCPLVVGVLPPAVALHRAALGLLLVTPRVGRWLREHDGSSTDWRLCVPVTSALVVTFLSVGLVVPGSNMILAG